MYTYIVDFESLYDKNLKTCFIQEFAYYDLKSNTAHNDFFRLPLHIDYKKYWYQSKNVNHIPKDYGKLSFQIIRDFLNQDAIFYVKGNQKLKFLKQITNKKIINLDDLGCPKYSLLTNRNVESLCSFICHSDCHKNCALNKVYKLNDWIKLNNFSL